MPQPQRSEQVGHGRSRPEEGGRPGKGSEPAGRDGGTFLWCLGRWNGVGREETAGGSRLLVSVVWQVGGWLCLLLIGTLGEQQAESGSARFQLGACSV